MIYLNSIEINPILSIVIIVISMIYLLLVLMIGKVIPSSGEIASTLGKTE